jgi:hypothetical protein
MPFGAIAIACPEGLAHLTDSLCTSVSILMAYRMLSVIGISVKFVNSLIRETMANICTNKLYLSTGDRQLRDTLVSSLEKTFNCYDVQSNDCDDFDSEIEFDSRWVFPQDEMEALTKDLPEDNDLYIRVLSYDFCNEYVGYHIYTSGEWCDKFADR